MVKVKEFSINLDDSKIEYFAGENIAGHVTVELADPSSILRITLTAQGIGTCNTGRSSTEVIYRNVITLFGSHDASENTERTYLHPAGLTSYQFNYSLPTRLPSSVSSERHGSIKYSLRAKIDIKGFGAIFSSGDCKIKKPIIIKEIIDANIPRYELQDVQTAKRIPSIFSNQKKLEKDDLLVTLSRGVCCPEEKANIQLQYKNGVAKKMGLVKVRLNKYSHFNKIDNKIPYKKLIAEIGDEKRRNDKIYQRTIELNIPKQIPPTNTLTNAVVINYTLHVKVEGYREVKLPIIIGTVPYVEGLDDIGGSELVIANSTMAAMTQTHHPQQIHTSPSAPVLDDAMFEAGSSSMENTSLSTTNIPMYMLDSDEFDPATEINCEFHHPPPYIPEDEFDLPPSYDQAISTSANQHRLVEAS